MDKQQSQLLEKAQASGELLPLMFSSSSDLIAITRASDQALVAVNPAWQRAIAYSEEEVVGRSSAELNLWVDPQQRQNFVELLERAGSVSKFECLFRRKDGSHGTCLITACGFDSNGEKYFFFSSQDVTAGRQAEKTVLASRALLVDAIESINEGFVLYDADRRLIICNSKFREFYGYSEEEAAPGVSGVELGRLDVVRGRVLLPVRERADEYMNRRNNLRPKESKFTVVQLRDGRYLLLSDRQTDGGGIVSIQTDITELKQAEKELAKLRDDAVAANRAKSEFLAHMSHELRTPLNSILGFSQVMSEQLFGALGHKKYSDYVRLVLQSGEHLLSLINDVLDLSKVEAGELLLDEKPFDLSEALSSSTQMITGRKEGGRCIPRLDVGDDLPLFLGDERLMRQILLNLLSNAVKFTDPAGEVVVSVDCSLQDGWRISVSDTGCGMTPEDIPKALEPFGQVRRGAHQSHEGTGLGLSLSKKLTELHQGQLEITSELGAGTEVVLTFPKSRALKLARDPSPGASGSQETL
ncbi:PAS domain-containing sensor histidine kinase [Rhodovibrionaceae bacterium A322]